MKTIWDYPVSAPYGYSDKYDGFHTGEDRGNRSALGLPVTVNGVVVGTVGWTGFVLPKSEYGTHTHIGKWAGGQSYNPNGGGKLLGSDAVVTQIDTEGKTNNGKFVRVRSGGYDWVYLHLNEVKVNVGDKLINGGGDMPQPIGNTKPDDAGIKRIYQGWMFENPDDNAMRELRGKDFDTITAQLDFTPRRRALNDKINWYDDLYAKYQEALKQQGGEFEAIPGLEYNGQQLYKKKEK
jgi:hypothetical protein